MQDYIFLVVDMLSVLTLIGGVLVALLVLSFVPSLQKKLAILTKHELWLMLVVAVIATMGSLFFSEIAGWAPCKDCWLQRIFMYPQVVLLAVAIWKRDSGVAKYILALSLIGIVLSTHHYIEQIEATFFAPANALVPCDDTGVSCAKTYTFRFGYITIPMMALTAFIINAVSSLKMLRKH